MGASSELSLPGNLWPQSDKPAATQNGVTFQQQDGLLTVTVSQQVSGWNNLRFAAMDLPEGWYMWTAESITTPNVDNSPKADCTDNQKYSISSNSGKPVRLPAGNYKLQVTCHNSLPGTYTSRPYLYRIPC